MRTDPDAPVSGPATWPAGPNSRRIWAWSDSHLGAAVDDLAGRPAEEWMGSCFKDLKGNVGLLDYAIPLGDITDTGTQEQLQDYVRIRDASGIRTWYELAGNHEYAAVPAGRWATYIGRPARYAIFDGNCIWFLLSANQGRDVGWQPKAAVAWLKESIAANQDRNVIVCTHQPVYGTVAGSTGKGSHLSLAGPSKDSSPTDAKPFADLLEEVRVDLWLSGHIHAGRRTARYIARRGPTTFINVSALGRAYGTGACTSYLLEMKAGEKDMLARCRDHEAGRYLEDQEVRIGFRHPWRFAEKPTVILPRSGLVSVTG
jgi:predicted phosphohydrolase